MSVFALAEKKAQEMYALPGHSIELSSHLFEFTPQDAFESRFLRSLERQTFMCSPEGRVLKLDLKGLMETLDFWEFTLTHLNTAVRNHPGLGEVPGNFEHTFRLGQIDKTQFIIEMEQSSETGQSVMGLAEEYSLLSRHQQIPMFFERVGYTITLQSYDFIQKIGFIELEEFEDIARIMRPFEGWALCVTGEFAEGDWLNSFRSNFAPHSSPEGALQGRPATTRRRTLEAYEALYPDGHGPNAWLEVLRAVNHSTGLAASLDTLKRAVRIRSVTQKSN